MWQRVGDQVRSGLLALERSVGRAVARGRAIVGPLGTAGAPRAELVVAPPDYRTGDPTRAADMEQGRWFLAGKLVVVDAVSPFDARSPSTDWTRELLAFGWLRHKRAANTGVLRATTRVLFGQWLASPLRRSRQARDVDILTRRVLSLLSHAPLLLEDADPAFHRRFVDELASDVERLKSIAVMASRGVGEIVAAIALAQAAVCLAASPAATRGRLQRVARLLERQILPDGGHVSRAPDAVSAILAELLPLKQTCLARDIVPPEAIQGAIDRMMAMLRFLRHGDGSFAHFNGTGPTDGGLVAALLASDDTAGAMIHASYTGYDRLQAGRALVLVDTGAPPPIRYGMAAHASPLAFEFSDAAQRIIVGCGLPATGADAWRPHARATAAHAALVVADTSIGRWRGATSNGSPLLGGAGLVASERSEEGGSVVLSASHDGYAGRFRLIHERRLALAADGGRFEGEDRLVPSRANRPMTDKPIAIRFHLHPAVRASKVRDGRSILLVLPNRTAWEFSADAGDVALEESVYLAAADGPRRTEQIVVHGRTRGTPLVRWQFVRVVREDPAPTRKRGEHEPERLI